MPRPLTPAQITEVSQAVDGHGGWIECNVHDRPVQFSLPRGSARSDPYVAHSLVFFTPDPPQAIPLHSVNSLTVKDRSAGALRGTWVGGLAGLLAGVLFTAAIDSAMDWGEPPSRRDYLDMAEAGALLGAGIGALIGVGVGQRTQFTF